MTTYVLRRLFQNIMLVFVAGLLIYTTVVMLLREPSTPGPRYSALIRRVQNQPPEQVVQELQQIEELEQKYKLDKPWPISFLTWLFDPSDTETTEYDIYGNVITKTKGIDVNIFGLQVRGSGFLTGDFGRSNQFAGGIPISQIFADRWLNTLELFVASLALALLIGVPLGVLGAVRQRTGMDHMLTLFALGGLSSPPFVLGLLFIMFFAVLPKALYDQNGWTWLPWLPPGSVGDTGDFWDRINHLVLPAVTLAIPQIAWLSRYTRFAMLDVLQQEYIRTAWAKGLRARRVVFKHALRNTLIPVITQLSLLPTTLISSAIVVETVFAYEGMGKAFFSGLGGCLIAGTLIFTGDPRPCPVSGFWPVDYPLALVLLLILVVIIGISNLLADVLYAFADPRIRYEGRSMK